MTAHEKYIESSKLAPHDPAPKRNLSATELESGRYEACIESANEAIQLTQSQGGDDVATQVKILQQRIAKAKRPLFETPTKAQAERRLTLLKEVR